MNHLTFFSFARWCSVTSPHHIPIVWSMTAIRKLLAVSKKKSDEELHAGLEEFSASIVMGSERYVRSLDVREGVSILVDILKAHYRNSTYADTIVASLRALGAIYQYGVLSYTVGHGHHKALIVMSFSAIRSTLSFEWRHAHTDSSMMLEEALNVIRFVAKYDLTGTVLSDANVRDLLTVCTLCENALVTRTAFEALCAMCSKVVLPSEFGSKPLSSYLPFGNSTPKSSPFRGANHPIVVDVEQLICPFLVSTAEQLTSALEYASDSWVQLKLVLTCIGNLIERSLLCHRVSTGRAVAPYQLFVTLFTLARITLEDKILDPVEKTSRILLCESILYNAGCCNRVLLSKALTDAHATQFFSLLLQQNTSDSSMALEKPFGLSDVRKDYEGDFLPLLGGIQLLVAACPNVPPVAFGDGCHVLLPLPQWKWEDEQHVVRNFTDHQSIALECFFSTLKQSAELEKTSEKANFLAMTCRRGSEDHYHNISRGLVPFGYQFCDEKLLRPRLIVKECGPEVRESSLNTIPIAAFYAMDSDVVNPSVTVTSKELECGERYFATLCSFAIGELGYVRRLAIHACASMLHMLLLSSNTKQACKTVAKTMLLLCDVVKRALSSSDSTTNSIALTMVKWLMSREDQMQWNFSVDCQRSGLLHALATLGHSSRSKPPHQSAVCSLASKLHGAIEKKMKKTAGNPLLYLPAAECIFIASKNLSEAAVKPGIHEDVVSQFFSAVDGGSALTPFETHQMKIASSVLLYLLDGNSLAAIMGPTLTFFSEGFGSSRDQRITTLQNSFIEADAEFSVNSLSSRYRVDKLLRGKVNPERMDCFVQCGLNNVSSFRALIKILISTLSLDTNKQAPLVESSVFSVVQCRPPKNAFITMGKFSPSVGLCKALSPVAEQSNPRVHLMATVGDIERTLRTGSATTKNTFSSPTSQSCLGNVSCFTRRVIMYLHTVIIRNNPLSKEAAVSRKVLDGATPERILVLSSLVYSTLSKFLLKGKLESDVKGVPVPPPMVSAHFSAAERSTLEEIIKVAVETRLTLFRRHSGKCSLRATFFGLLYEDAFRSGDKKALMCLEEMIMLVDGSKLRSEVDAPTSKKGSKPIRGSKAEFSNHAIREEQSYAFHCFEGSQSSCLCSKFSLESFFTSPSDSFHVQTPQIAYRDDLIAAIILFNYLHDHDLLRENTLGQSSEELFTSPAIATLVLKSCSASALRLALLPPTFALPRWVNYLFVNAKFLFPFPLREKLCKFAACGARRALIKHLHRTPLGQCELVSTVSELSILSNHKYQVSRETLVSDAVRVLTKGGDCALPISFEFKGDVGVGEGPTAQFYTLLAKEFSNNSLSLWNSEAQSVLGESNSIIPSLEGLYPKPMNSSSLKLSEEVNTILQDRVSNCLSGISLHTASSMSMAYYTVGIALGRAFVDNRVFPLHLSSALAMFLQFGSPFYKVAFVTNATSNNIQCPVDLFDLTLDDLRMVSGDVANSLERLQSCDAATLSSLQIPFTLPGDDNFELITNGKNVFVTRENLHKYVFRVVAAVLYESVANPIRLMVTGFCDIVSSEALYVLTYNEISLLMCGELRRSSVPLWSFEEIRSVLVGDHGYHNDSPQIEMLAEILGNRFTPNEQQAFIFFVTGCPRLPFGGVRAIGVITVVRREDAFHYFRDASPPLVDEDQREFAASGTSQEVLQGQSNIPVPPPIEDNDTFGTSWALPSVNTCFRYLKLPPYPNIDLMQKKLLLSIVQSGDSFELS